MMYLFHKKQRDRFILVVAIFSGAYDLSCKNKRDGNIDNSTRIFTNYMKQMYGMELPQTLTHFIILPANTGCEGCKKRSFRYFEDHRLPSNCKIIAGKNIEGQITPKFGYQYYIDTVDKIERLRLNTQSTALITVKHKRVISNIEINPDNLDSVLSSLKGPL